MTCKPLGAAHGELPCPRGMGLSTGHFPPVGRRHRPLHLRGASPVRRCIQSPARHGEWRARERRRAAMAPGGCWGRPTAAAGCPGAGQGRTCSERGRWRARHGGCSPSSLARCSRAASAVQRRRSGEGNAGCPRGGGGSTRLKRRPPCSAVRLLRPNAAVPVRQRIPTHQGQQAACTVTTWRSCQPPAQRLPCPARCRGNRPGPAVGASSNPLCPGLVCFTADVRPRGSWPRCPL